jgi:hypothetical protein
MVNLHCSVHVFHLVFCPSYTYEGELLQGLGQKDVIPTATFNTVIKVLL